MTGPVPYWESLSPRVQRAVAWGAGILLLLGVAALAVETGEPRQPAAGAQDKLVRNLLTDTDPRSLGIEGLAVRLERLERSLDGLAQQAAKTDAPPAPAPREDDAQAQERRREIDTLQAQLEELRRQVAAARQAPAPAPRPEARIREPAPAPPAVPSAPAAPARAERPLDQLFVPPSVPAVASPPPGAARNAARALEIRVVGVPAAPGRGGQSAPPPDALFVPAGAILSGVLLNGLDAPTGQGARKDPTPALLRLKRDAILPNRFRADVKECFAILGGFGDLGSERALLRSETLSCVRADGGVIEVPLDAYAVGEDGKVGVRGRLVGKQGALLAKALQAGFLTSFAKVFTQVPSIPIATVGSQLQFQSMLTPQAAAAGAASGVGGAMDRLADYYMEMAEQTFPVLEIDAGRAVELIVNKGVSLRLAR